MFTTEVDIESLSKKATVRWKKHALSPNTPKINHSQNKRLRSLIITSRPENFLSLSSTAPDTSRKVSKHEDLPELSAELSALRKKHDLNRGSNFLFDLNMSSLQKQLLGFKQEEIKTLNRLSGLKNEVGRLEEALFDIVKKQEEALEATGVYEHIIERMRINKLRLDIKNEEISQLVKVNKRNLEEEIEICRKKKESKIKTKKALQALEGFVEQETKEKEVNVSVAEKDMKRRLENSNKREERYRRQIEIAERAANEDREARATQMREDVILMRFWCRYMRKRLEFDMNRLSYIEEAFEKVRKNSNVNDASEMITKVLTTEIAYNDLKKIVENSNHNIFKTQEKIEEIEKNLKKAEKTKTHSVKDTLQREILEKLKIGVDYKNKLIKLKETHHKIHTWSARLIKKLDGTPDPTSLHSTMQTLLSLVRSQTSSVKSKPVLPTLQTLLNSIDPKTLSKPRSDSSEHPSRPVLQDLVYSSSSLEIKPKK